MNLRQHALCARALLDACGGVDEACNALEKTPFARGRTQLYHYRDAAHPETMPAGVIAVLEEYSGKPIYSQILFERRPANSEAADLIAEGCDVGESGLALQALIRKLAGDDDVSENDAIAIEAALQAHEQETREVRAALERARPARAGRS